METDKCLRCKRLIEALHNAAMELQNEGIDASEYWKIIAEDGGDNDEN